MALQALAENGDVPSLDQAFEVTLCKPEAIPGLTVAAGGREKAGGEPKADG